MICLAPARRHLVSLIGLIALCTCLRPISAIAAPIDTPPPRLAWVVGNARYEGMTPLNNPAHDAQDMCQSLRRLHFKTLCHTDIPDRATVLKLFAEFVAQLTPDSHGLVYYAGHAVQIQGHNYLVPTRASVRNMSDVPQQLVDVQDLLDQIKSKGNTFNVVTLDACREDPFAGSLPTPGDTGPNLLRGLSVQNQQAGPIAYGLGAIRDAPIGTIVLYATGANDVALDGNGRNGLLTKHLLAHIETPGITVEDMIKRVGAGVRAESQRLARKGQTPFVYSSFTGEFCFAGCASREDQHELTRLRAQNQMLEQKIQQGSPASSPAPRPAQPVVPAIF